MKAICALVLGIVLVSVSIIVSFACAVSAPSVGVKKGDWVEYSVTITGPYSAPSHNITWFRMEVLDVEDAAFQANITVRYVNGTFQSSVWDFNFTQGQVEGWVVIPANLKPGSAFFDVAKPGLVTIEGQEQRIVAGASRTVTYANDSLRNKQWDRATGVYTYSVEHPKNFTVISYVVATNMWLPQTFSLNSTLFYSLICGCVFAAALVLFWVMVDVERKSRNKLSLRHLSQGKIAVFTILGVVMGEVGFILFFPFSKVGLSFAEINLVMQTVWTALVYVSLWFRLKGNRFLHEILMLVVISAWLIGFSAVMIMDPLTIGSSKILSNSPSRLVMNSLHAVFSIPALGFGLWLVALWRPGSMLFEAKSRRIAQLLAVFWIPAYVVGVVDFLLLHTTFFG